MLTPNLTPQEPIHSQVAPEELIAQPEAATETGVISFRLSRQTLTVSALIIVLAISVFETIELTRLHQALKVWQALPTATVPAASGQVPVTPTGEGALPSQVGGC